MPVTKKSSSRVIFFCGKSCKPVTRITAKKKLHVLMIFLHTRLLQKKVTQLDDFFVHAFTAKKLHDVTIFFVTHIYRKKNYTTYRKQKLHDVTFFCYTRLPQKKNNCTTLLQRNNYQFD